MRPMTSSLQNQARQAIFHKATTFALLLFTFISILLSGQVYAQVDPGFGKLFQVDRHVGTIWVPERLPEACEYQEHWFLFPDYQYPGSAHPVETIIQMEEDQNFESLEHFLETMEQEHPEGHHITTIAIDHREDCP